MSDTTTGTPNLNKALSQLQGELPRIKKTKTGKIEGENKAGKYFSYEYSYADLGDVVADIGPLMAKFGLAFHCGPTINPADRREMILAWALLHESGEEKTGEWPLGPVNQKPQSLGSAITYGRRYCFTAATNIVLEDDDDGQRAQQAHVSRQSAGDAFESAAPATPNRGKTSRLPHETAPYPSAQAAADEAAIDEDAQVFAEEAHEAAAPSAIDGIHERARKAGMLTKYIRNPASGGTGQLALYLDWRRKQLASAVRLSSDDPWAQKVADLADEAEAVAALDEIAELAVAQTMDLQRAEQVETAIRARFPMAGKREAQAA